MESLSDGRGYLTDLLAEKGLRTPVQFRAACMSEVKSEPK